MGNSQGKATASAGHIWDNPHYLNDLIFDSCQQGGSNLAAFFKAPDGTKGYVKFDGIPKIYNDDKRSKAKFADLLKHPERYTQKRQSVVASKSEVLAAKLYFLAGVRVAQMHLVFIRGAEENGPVGIWSRFEDCDDIDEDEMRGLPGLKEGYAADAWLANWDVIGNGTAKQMNMKRARDGRALRLDFGACLWFRAQGGRKDDPPFGADAVPEITSLREFNREFADVDDEVITQGVSKLAASASDESIEKLVEQTLGSDAENMAEILIGRRNVLQRDYPSGGNRALRCILSA